MRFVRQRPTADFLPPERSDAVRAPVSQPIARAPVPKPCHGCSDQRAAELVRAARARDASQTEILRLLREQREA